LSGQLSALSLQLLFGAMEIGDDRTAALQAIGTRLMDEAKRKVSERSDVAGIELSMSPDDTEMRSSSTTHHFSI
jgi:hypothetical protein